MPLKLRPRMKSIVKRITSPKGAFVIGLFVTLFLLPYISIIIFSFIHSINENKISKNLIILLIRIWLILTCIFSITMYLKSYSIVQMIAISEIIILLLFPVDLMAMSINEFRHK